MKTQNICFTDLKNLADFIVKHDYAAAKNLLIQVFTSDLENKYLEQILELLTNNLPSSVIIGATTDGEILDGKSVSQQTIISFTVFKNVTLKAQLYDLNQSHFKLGNIITEDLYKSSTKAIILFADGLKVNGEDLLDGIYDINKDIIVAGGLAGDYRQMRKTFVICNGQISSDSVVACALDSTDLIVNTSHVYGWYPIGKQMIVTKASQNRLYELDNEPLRNIYAKYLGENVAKQLPVSAGEYPLVINRFGKRIARAALNLLPDGSMLYAGNFKIGDKVQFGYGHIPRILSNANEITQSISSMPIESIFIYSCSARKYFMREQVNTELAPLNYLGATVGFFTYGEFFHGSEKNELLNETMTLLLLSESTSVDNKIPKHDCNVVGNGQDEQIYNTLFHLIEATGNELSETNEKLEDLVAEKTKELTEKIYYDSLTKLPNRNLLMESFGYKSKYIPVMLAIINIDDFKKINDYYGHKVGDMVILNVANVINELIKTNLNAAGYMLYKLPVDEFAVAANATIRSKDFSDFINVILTTLVNNKISFESDSFFLNFTAGVSIGRAESADFLQEADGVLLQANMALRQAKDNKAQMVTYKDDMILRKQLEDNILWTGKIKQALTNDKFVPYFQPIFSSVTGKIEKYECLIRMIDDDSKVISPYVFLDVAKKAKLYSKLTKVMVEKCFSIFSQNKYNFSINISILDIEDSETVEFIKSQIKHYNIGKQLTLEILESEGFGDYAELNAFLNEMKKLGCKIAIDDFGSGYSNFKHIIMMNIDYLKIDGSLIKNINDNEQNRAMVEMIIDFCKKSNIFTVAEFVADKQIYDTVKSLEVDYIQGFYLAEPAAECVKF